MKKLKFAEPLPSKILSGRKNTTWRINDDKEIIIGDLLSLCYINDIEFAKAKVISINESTFGKLSESDKEGHEKFDSEEEMYAIYSKYYNFQVTPETNLKVIKFELL